MSPAGAWRRARDAARLARLGLRRRDRLRIAALVAATPLRRRGRLPPHRGVRLALQVAGAPLDLVVDAEDDLRVLEELAGPGGYDFSRVPEPAVVVDAGSHVGAFVLLARRRWPAARILAFEPDPHSFAKLRRNAGGLAGVQLHRLALGRRNGTLTLHRGGAGEGWRSSVHRQFVWQTAEEVPCRRLADVLRESGVQRVDLLKVDVEGAELEVLDGVLDAFAVRAVVGEVHPDLLGADLPAFTALFDGWETDLPRRPARRTTFTAVRRAP